MEENGSAKISKKNLPKCSRDEHFALYQGKRGILWEWFGQLRHLPPPSVGIAPPVAAGGPAYSHNAGDEL